jgi:ribosomal protein S15P/S13E
MRMPVKKKSGKKEKKKTKKLSQREFEKKVLDLAKIGLTSEKIGEKLRQEGIHPKEHGKKISLILKEHDQYINPDLKNIETKLERIKRHLEKNKQDKRALREKDRIFAHLRKLKIYFKKI